jgi:hypothetical protein
MPSASVTMTAAENHRWAAIIRNAKRRSWNMDREGMQTLVLRVGAGITPAP